MQDPIDTASPQGKFTLQVLGAAAEFERALIRERTRAGLRSAKAEGRIGGNPGLKAGDPVAIRKARAARVESHFQKLNASAAQWLPEVRRLRLGLPWEDVLRVVNSGLPREVQPWSLPRLIRAAKTFVREGLLSESILSRATASDKDDRLPAMVAGIKGSDPKMTLQAICNRLEAMCERTPRGRSKWEPSSVKMILERAKKVGLL